MTLKTVLITGCSDNGIGSALGKVFHERGYHVFATARNLSKMKWIQGLDRITPVVLDITKAADIQAAVEAVTKATDGRLNHLVNNAGRNDFMPVLDADADAVRNLFESNYFGPLLTTQAFAPLLIKVRRALQQILRGLTAGVTGKRTSLLHYVDFGLREYAMDGYVSCLAKLRFSLLKVYTPRPSAPSRS
jgi:NAD(P)-dependent dehydrogenase (short-subunit alcohol dehydrogenase family)